MSGFTAVYTTEKTTFENYTWDYTRGTVNNYDSIGLEIWLFESQIFENYKTYLGTSDNAGEANNIVDNAEPALTAATLNTFQSKIDDYDGYAIFMLVKHEAFTKENQTAAGCIHHEDYGMTCASINTTNDFEEDEEGKSYWFPDTSSTALNAIAGGTKDLWGETSHLIDSYYGGLNRWQVLHISDTSF